MASKTKQPQTSDDGAEWFYYEPIRKGERPPHYDPDESWQFKHLNDPDGFRDEWYVGKEFGWVPGLTYRARRPFTALYPGPTYTVYEGTVEPYNPTTWASSPHGSLPTDAEKRNEYPMADGLLDYFPNALAEVSRLSLIATQQHHQGEDMHWQRGVSMDHRNKIVKHLIDAGKFDTDNVRHSAKLAWRALANLQQELEREEGAPVSRASR